MTHTRRTILGALPAIAAARAAASSWKPKIGVLGRYTEANIEFAREAGFKSLELVCSAKSRMDATTVTDQDLDKIKKHCASAGLEISVLGIPVNHTAPDPAKRAEINAYVSKVIEMAGKLEVPYLATMSGNMPGRPLAEQVDEIVRVYNEKYFRLCEKHKVRLIWEPWPEGPNVATGPIGYEALFKAFGDSPFVGIQYDASHLVRQFMDPLQCLRDWVGKVYNVHLKDTEIFWHVLKKSGINPPARTQWWRYRIPGYGSVDWPGVFTVLMDAGYKGSMNIEHEDDTYGRPLPDGNFSEDYKVGFRMGLRYLRQYVPV